MCVCGQVLELFILLHGWGNIRLGMILFLGEGG